MDDGRETDRKADRGDSEDADERRFNETLRKMLNTPPKPHKTRYHDEKRKSEPKKK